MNTQPNDQKSLEQLRHSTSHLLAAAILQLWPGTKPALGPATETGFYYDFAFAEQISEKDFKRIEQKMHEIAKTWTSFTRVELTPQEAKKEFADNPYKTELIEEHSGAGEKITVYQSGEFRDLCKGNHIDASNNTLKYFKILSIAGAYWRGNEKNAMLTRIYGTAFFSQEDLDHYLWQVEEAKRRDHRKLGVEYDLFTFSEYVGSGLPLYTQRGALIRRLLNQYVEDIQIKQGYLQVWTPQIVKAELFKKSGHYDKYKGDMFHVVSNYSDDEFFLKPMNCPQHTQIFASRPRSYKELPIRLTDFAMLYRDEKPGELSGLTRVRSFSQDDCHIFCRMDQVDEEIDKALTMTKQIMDTFGFSYRYRLSIRDKSHQEKYIGDPNEWDKAEAWAEKIMQRNNIEYYIGEGEAAFYAPKMDLMAKDALGREWQLSTIQIDLFMPERFELSYIGEDGQKHRPVMIHRAIIGSAERFMGVIIEHFAGAFPVWICPEQVEIIPITSDQIEYANGVADVLRKKGVRAEVHAETESMQNRIRKAEKQKVPYMIILGKKEQEEKTISVRARGNKTLGEMATAEKFASYIQEKIETKSLEV